MDDRQFRNTMGKFATGVTIITTELDGNAYGMTANAFMSVSLNPKLVVISVGHKAKMLQRIRESKRYAVNILSSDQQQLSAVFAGQKNDDILIPFATMDRLPILENTIGAVTCNLVAEHTAGDHSLLIGEVTDLRMEEGEPLLFFQGQYHELKERVNS
ncbi:flavin reductase family protein [Bacillus sp. 1P10SD]|uniref:flavin reductase family protein n=1 Tax=Bacillus sp. 1P10SD TaxID=3132265 RepID=UPI0039A4EFCC